MDPSPIPESIRQQLLGAVETHSKPLEQYAYSLCGCEHRARDAVQETFLRLVKRQTPIDPASRLAPWLYRVCRTRIIDQFKKEGRMTTTDQVPETPPEETDSRFPSHLAETNDSLSVVSKVLHTLPKNQREVVRLKFHSQLTYKEIAEITELSVSNVGFILNRAIHTLRDRLKAESDLIA
ncbi:MAG: RNA polymerase sigma factor [Opitutales bacterium]